MTLCQINTEHNLYFIEVREQRNLWSLDFVLIYISIKLITMRGTLEVVKQCATFKLN